ncbi:MAG: tetratricopeptide repeat protein [Magnetococcus sp. DMHC-6]
MMRPPRNSINFLDEVGFLFHAGGRAIRRVSVAAIQSFNALFAPDGDIRYEYYRNKGIQYTKNGRYYQAIPLLEGTLQSHPKDLDVLFHLGFCYIKLEHVREGIDLLEKARALGDTGPRLPSILGLAYIQEKQYDKAVEMLQQAVDHNPDNYNLNYRLGVAWGHLERNDKAVEAFQKAIKIRPEEIRTYRSIGFALEQMGKRDEALPYFKRAAEMEELQHEI